jgi:hypothetical protein
MGHFHTDKEILVPENRKCHALLFGFLNSTVQLSNLKLEDDHFIFHDESSLILKKSPPILDVSINCIYGLTTLPEPQVRCCFCGTFLDSLTRITKCNVCYLNDLKWCFPFNYLNVIHQQKSFSCRIDPQILSSLLFPFDPVILHLIDKTDTILLEKTFAYFLHSFYNYAHFAAQLKAHCEKDENGFLANGWSVTKLDFASI